MIDNDFLNTVGDFTYHGKDQTVNFKGILYRRDDKLYLNGTMSPEDARICSHAKNCQISGNVSTKKITLLECHISSHGTSMTNEIVISKIEFCPSQIVVGIAQGTEILLSSARLYIHELNQVFFSTDLFEVNYSFSKENPALLSFVFPQSLEAADSDGKLVISRTFSVSDGWEKTEFHSKPFVEFSFFNPTTINSTISKLACVRNLLAFFADSILPLDEIEFSIGTKKPYENFDLYINHHEDGRVTKEPFIINETAINDSFPYIWTNWIDFYENNEPIAALFYEIITNHPTGINSFLNLCQCLEIYSTRFREAEAKALWKNKYPTDKKFALKHRIEDILIFCNPYLHFSEGKCAELATVISNARNYYTHYGKNRTAPSLESVVYSDILLHLILLIIVFTTLGISSDSISQAIHCRSYSNISSVVDRIM